MPTLDADLKVCRIASLTIVNAMIFQQVLAARNRHVKSLSRTTDKEHVADEFLKIWTFILEKRLTTFPSSRPRRRSCGNW